MLTLNVGQRRPSPETTKRLLILSEHVGFRQAVGYYSISRGGCLATGGDVAADERRARSSRATMRRGHGSHAELSQNPKTQSRGCE